LPGLPEPPPWLSTAPPPANSHPAAKTKKCHATIQAQPDGVAGPDPNSKLPENCGAPFQPIESWLLPEGRPINHSAGGPTNRMFQNGSAARLRFRLTQLILRPLLVCEVHADLPTFSFIKNKSTGGNTIGKTTAAPPGFSIPVLVKNFEVRNAVIEYIDYDSTPVVEIEAGDIYVTGTNLGNYVFSTAALPGEILVHGHSCGGAFQAVIKVDIARAFPAFDINFEMEHVDLVQLNSLFKAYGKFDVHAGKLSFYTEAAANGSEFTGYVKPVITDLEMVGPRDKGEGVIHALWESLLGTVAEVFQNQKHDQLATKIPFKGVYKDVNINTWYAIVETLRNAFVHALKPSIDYEINIRSVTENSKL
jgi:hypothetical protein